MGRICVWFEGADEANFPREPTETMLARLDLIAELSRAMDTVRDPWIVGQLVHYLAEDEQFREAEQVARECDLPDGWWCSALLGYALHLQDRFVEAEDAFRAALLHLPPDEEDRWLAPRFLLDSDATRELDRLAPPESQAKWDLLWRLSDPLFLVEGNDRWTEHFARLVEARNQEVAANPYGLQWEEDLEESLVRYRRNLGYSRVRSIPTGPGPGGLTLQDTRRVVGHHHPGSRGYLFPGEFLESPADVPPESWITAPQTSRTWYAPPYAPDFRGLETQVARFRRGDEMLVVGAYRPAPGGRDPLADLSPSGQPEDDFDSRSINLKPEPARRVGCCPGWVDYSVPGILIAPACPASRRAVASWPAW